MAQSSGKGRPVLGGDGPGGGAGGGAFPGFGTTPPNIGPNVGTAGVALTAERSDARPGQNLVAQWTLGAANRRVYLVDGVNGNDANPGFLDGGSANFPISGATVAATAKRTLGALDTIFPRFGNGRHVEVIIANGGVNTVGTYADALETFLNGYTGYAGNCPLVRGTGTNTTAGATAFAGDAADNDYAGGITVTGLNAPGYNPTGVPTNQVIQCLQVGGAAPALPAEPAAPLGWRIRFDANTTTVALRNICRMVAVVTTDTITTATTLPAVPVAADVFYLEQAGWTFPASTLVGSGSFSGGNGGGRGLQIVGGRCTGNITLNGVAANFAFSGCATLGPSSGFVGVAQTFVSATLGLRTPGGGMHMTGNFSSVLGGCYFLNNAVCEGLIQVLQPVSFLWALGSVAGTGVSVQGGAPNNQAGITGVGSEAGQLPCRILGSSVTTGAGLSLGSGVFRSGGIVITNSGARPAFLCLARVTQLSGTTLTGATGNNDVGLAFLTSGASVPNGDSLYNANGNVNTLSGALGDIRINNGLAAGQIVTWAQLVATGIADARGSRAFAAGFGPLARVKFSGAIVTSAGGATISYLADTGAQLIAANLANQLYPTSVMLALRLRVTKLYGAGVVTNSIVATLYRNGVATTMTVSIPPGDVVGTQYVDSAHPQLFADGDTFDLRLDDAADALAGVAPVSGVLEYSV